MENQPIITQWHFDFFVVLLIVAMICLYGRHSGFKNNERSMLFWSAILFFILAECSPLHFLGMHYYFSAHMISHIIILLICGPLLVMSLKTNDSANGVIHKLSVFLNKYFYFGWLAGVGIMWFWHIPALFDASLTHMMDPFSIMPVLHGGSMLIAGMLFSWPLFGPYADKRVHPMVGVIYLFTACISCSLLGLLITFAPLNTYHHYLALSSSMNMGNTNPWNISAEADQQAAGLIMWVPCCFVYLAGCIYLLQKWFAENDTSEKAITI